MTQDEAFKAWWYTEGSQPPFKHHDCEEHTMRMCEIAWANGAFKEREACAIVCDKLPDSIYVCRDENSIRTDAIIECIDAIRARGEQA